MGAGGLKERTALQLLHSAYSLAQCYRQKEWDALWKLINAASCTQLSSLVLSRWECVGEACEHIVKNFNSWKVLVEHVIKTEKSDTQRYVIASHLYSLLKEKMILSHFYFIHAFIQSWWGPNFSWHKHIDPKTKQHGFLARHLPVQFYLQHRDLQSLKTTGL